MKIVRVSYGRSIEVGKFGCGPYGKVWFGWDAECEEGQEDDALEELRVMADGQEVIERNDFHMRHDKGF